MLSEKLSPLGLRMAMISKFALQRYFDRPLRDLNQFKSLKEVDTDGFKFKTKPFLHQKICFHLGIKYSRLLYFLDMGLGKSKIALDLIKYRVERQEVRQALILVPNLVNIESWKDQIKFHYGKTDKINIMTYMGALRKCCVLKANHLQVDLEACAAFAKQYEFIVYDESTALMNHQSTTFKVCRKLSTISKYSYGLTGTPFGRDPGALWSQFYVIDQGETFGSTLGLFRAAFFNTHRNYWGGYEHTFKKTKGRVLKRFIANRAISYRTEECFDLPKKVYVKLPVIFTDLEWSHYEQAVKDFRASQGNYQLLKSSFIKMRQITSGFFRMRDGETVVDIPFQPNPKLETLRQLLSELGSTEKVVIFHSYIFTGSMICTMLQDLKLSFVALNGGTPNKSQALRTFLDKKDCRVLVTNNQTGAFNLNLQCARYIIFFESPVSSIVRQQAERRCHRPGQQRTVFIYDLVVRNSVDERVLEFLKDGKTLFNFLLSYKV